MSFFLPALFGGAAALGSGLGVWDYFNKKYGTGRESPLYDLPAKLSGLFDKGWHYLSGQSDLESSLSAQMALQRQAQAFNSAEAVKDREWQQQMASTSYQRMMNDLKAAGLNPYLALTGGATAAPVGSGAQATSAVGSASNRQPKWSQLVSAANQLVNTGKSAANNVTTSALKIAAIAVMAAMA